MVNLFISGWIIIIIIIIIEGNSRAPIYRTRWDLRALYNNTHARTHAHTHTESNTHTGRTGTAVKKTV